MAELSNTSMLRPSSAPPDVGQREVLLIEDGHTRATSIGDTLAAAGFRMARISDGITALSGVDGDCVDLVLIGNDVSGADSRELCRQIRRSSPVPIIIVSAHESAHDVVLGLESGADDVLAGPIEAAELIARARSAMRRTVLRSDAVLRLGGLQIDPAAHIVRLDGRVVPLSSTQFLLLLELATHAGHVMTREALFGSVWDHDRLGDSRLVDMAVKRVRAKIEDDPHDPRRIVTVRGVGYRMDPS